MSLRSNQDRERVSTGEAVRITGLSARSLQKLCAAGKVPGAARLSKNWSFNLAALRGWIKAREEEAASRSTRAATIGVRERSAEEERINIAYELLISQISRGQGVPLDLARPDSLSRSSRASRGPEPRLEQ